MAKFSATAVAPVAGEQHLELVTHASLAVRPRTEEAAAVIGEAAAAAVETTRKMPTRNFDHFLLAARA